LKLTAKVMESTIDPAVIVAKLPTELKLIINTFTFICQMEDAFLTNDLQQMARLVCNYYPNPTSTLPPEPRARKRKTVACWVNALVSRWNRFQRQPSLTLYSSLTWVYESQTHLNPVNIWAGLSSIVRRELVTSR